MKFLSVSDVLRILNDNPNGTFVVNFTKRTTGEARRMVCVNYTDESRPRSYRPSDCYHVWDMEKGARRQFPLNAVHSITLVSQPKKAEPARKSFEQVRAEIHELFY